MFFSREVIHHARARVVAENFIRDLMFAAHGNCSVDAGALAEATTVAWRLRNRHADAERFYCDGFTRKAMLTAKYLILDPWQGLKFAAQWLTPRLYLRLRNAHVRDW